MDAAQAHLCLFMFKMPHCRGSYLNQRTGSIDGDGCIQVCKSSNREVVSLKAFVQFVIRLIRIVD